MKVMCMKSPFGWLIAAQIVGSDVPKVGDECTVKKVYTCKCGKHDVYDNMKRSFPVRFSVEEKAIARYYQVYELTGSEVMAAKAYWEILQTPQ